MSVKSLPAAMRPREKLLAQGPQALADEELVALLLRTGLPGQGVLGLAQEVLRRFGGLPGLVHASAQDLRQVKGLGPAKRAELTAVLEIVRRALASTLRTASVLDGPATVRDYLAMHLAHLEHEVFCALFLDHHHRLIALETLFRGTLTQTSVHPREVVKEALRHNASAVVLAHNHPSGQAEPSRSDEHLTHTLKAALMLVDVRVLDHLVVGRGQVVSMAERGLL